MAMRVWTITDTRQDKAILAHTHNMAAIAFEIEGFERGRREGGTP